jgi:hypothetical protein
MRQDIDPSIEEQIETMRAELRMIVCLLADHEFQIGDLLALKSRLYALLSEAPSEGAGRPGSTPGPRA